ncbi:LysR family transcriptional regulator [Brevibacterium album]|uniref:LysR family transcriptional regulator n=1 Tax=Brevibacterium album TaxID=417948 RepID=UPI00040610C3|nr:LysR family transcriptional regulator [Brevibacterium album]
MEFRQAEHFLAVAQHGGVGQAASALGCARPSLSQSIRRLEREIGAPLFHRLGRGLALTAAGTALLDPAQALLRDGKTVRATAAEHSGRPTGHIDIGATAGAYESPVIQLVHRLRRRLPQVTVRVTEYGSEADIVRAVRTGAVELGFGYADPEEADPQGRRSVQRHRLGDAELCVTLPESAAAGLSDPLPLADLPDLPVIAVSDGAHARHRVESVMRRYGVHTRLGVVTAHRHAAIPLVAAGAGLYWCTEEQARNGAAPGVASFRMAPPLRLSITLLHRRGALAPAARALQAAALAWAEEQR